MTTISTFRLDSPDSAFTITLDETIKLSPKKDKRYQIGLTSISTVYSWQNITSTDNNNKLKYNNGVLDRIMTFPDGIYSWWQLVGFIDTYMYDIGDTQAIRLYPLNERGVLELVVDAGYSVDFTYGKLNELLGFTSAIYPAGSYFGNVSDITNGQSRAYVGLNIVSSTYNDEQLTNTIFSFSPDIDSYGTLQEEPPEPIYVPLQTTQLDKIQITITGTDGRLIRNAGEDYHIQLHLIEI